MTHPLLTDSTIDRIDASWHDRVQIALAIADENLLKSLLLDCTPPLAQPHRIDGIHAKIAVPISSSAVADGTIEFEELHCILASPQQLERGVAEYSLRYGNRRGYLDLIRCEAETQTLGQGISLSHAISLLAHAGFVAAQVEEILHLPSEGWHKSWWYSVDAEGDFTVPFLRLMRSRRYPEGTYTLQYKDFFAQEQPTCFRSRHHQVLVEVLPEADYEFAQTLAKINLSRQQTGTDKALLICNRISDLEARGFISQGISLYAAHEIALPVKADCRTCVTANCPMQGRADSPVLLCQQFCIKGE